MFHAAFSETLDPAMARKISGEAPRDIQFQVNNAQARHISNLARKSLEQTFPNQQFDNIPATHFTKRLAQADSAEKFAELFAKSDPYGFASELMVLRRTVNNGDRLPGYLSMKFAQ
jgi:hypothetical protein